MTGRAAAVVFLMAISVFVTACGESAPPTILDTEAVERSIEDSAMAQRGADAQVSCPTGVHQEEGRVFRCMAVADGVSTPFVVTQVDGDGNVDYVAP